MDTKEWLANLKVGDKVAVNTGSRAEYSIAVLTERSTRKNARTRVFGVSYSGGGPVTWFDDDGYLTGRSTWTNSNIEPITDSVRASIKARKCKAQIRADIDVIKVWLSTADAKDAIALGAIADHVRSAKEATGSAEQVS